MNVLVGLTQVYARLAASFCPGLMPKHDPSGVQDLQIDGMAFVYKLGTEVHLSCRHHQGLSNGTHMPMPFPGSRWEREAMPRLKLVAAQLIKALWACC